MKKINNNSFWIEKGKLGTINGISNWHEFTWPEIGEDCGYICTRALPEFGKWNKIAPGQIDKITKTHIFEKPTPSYTTHTQSSKLWTIPLVSKKGCCFFKIMNCAIKIVITYDHLYWLILYILLYRL